MYKNKFILILAAVLSLAACNRTEQTGRTAVPLVEDIISQGGAVWELLSDFDESDSQGSIAVIGPADRNDRLSRLLLKGDDFDNIDGSLRPDRLPDFSGEQIDVISDDANSPYSGQDPQTLRTLTVQNFLAAMDQTFSLGAFDDEKLSHKLPSKVQIFSSPYSAAYGAFDIDTLCRSARCGVPVIFPSRQAFSAQLSRDIPHLHVVVLTDSLTAADGVYPMIFDELAAARGILGVGCVAVALKDSVSTVSAVLDAYRQGGGSMPLSAVIIDDEAVSVPDLEESLKEVFAEQTEQSLAARKLLTRDVRVVDMDRAAVQECCRILRRKNIFTHNIAYPFPVRYKTVAASSGDGCRLVESD